MEAGFAKVDITPRVGVELQGYGAFLNRHSDGVRDPLYARAFAFAVGGVRAVIVSCDLIGVSADIVAAVQEKVLAKTGLPRECVMVHATHTHSGPAVPVYIGWGTPDPPYLAILPARIAQACVNALGSLQNAVVSHAEVPCRGIAINRETDAFHAESSEEVMCDRWEPAKPEDTDTTCHVLRVDASERMLGFLSYYSCHPVIGGGGTRKIHGDWPGIATNLIEKQYPDTVGLFLQGAQGDINSCRVCRDEPDAMRVLDAVTNRYARYILHGLESAAPLKISSLRASRIPFRFSRKQWGREKLLSLLAAEEAVLQAPEATDLDQKVPLAEMRRQALQSLLLRLAAGEDLTPETMLHGIRLGPLAFLGSPFEVYRAIKNEVIERTKSTLPFVMGFTNDSQGYAVDEAAAKKGGYAADIVPYMCAQLPFANIHAELVDALLALDNDLAKKQKQKNKS